MKIYEVPTPAKASIFVNAGDKKVEFSSEIKGKLTDSILIDPIEYKGKTVGFATPGMVDNVTILVEEDKQLFIYRNVKITLISMKDGTKFHRISTEEDVRAANRRNSYRLYLGVQGTASIGYPPTVHNVIVKDISRGGVAFVIEKSVELRPGDKVQVSFTDKSTDSKFQLASTIVRKYSLGDSRVVYGCKLRKESDVIGRFVARKQRENKPED